MEKKKNECVRVWWWWWWWWLGGGIEASTAVAHWVAISDSLTAPVTRMQENICFTENKSSLNEGLEVKASASQQNHLNNLSNVMHHSVGPH